MIPYRLVERPAFDVIGRKTWIAGPDNSLFGRFWERCRAEGLFQRFQQISGLQDGAQTNGILLGISRVEADPSKRDFYYMIAVESPLEQPQDRDAADALETYRVPASPWAVFECRGAVPDAIVAAEMYAFMEWLPQSGYAHALAPEMEVYSRDEQYCEFWLPIAPGPGQDRSSNA